MPPYFLLFPPPPSPAIHDFSTPLIRSMSKLCSSISNKISFKSKPTIFFLFVIPPSDGASGKNCCFSQKISRELKRGFFFSRNNKTIFGVLFEKNISYPSTLRLNYNLILDQSFGSTRSTRKVIKFEIYNHPSQ